jgi:TonB-linked SusC/RagA family outer membrane protein
MKKILHIKPTRFLLLMALVLTPILSHSQQKVIKGVVKDEKGTPLQGVSISAKGSELSAKTDALGAFELALDSTAKALYFALDGYDHQVLPTKYAQPQLDIVMPNSSQAKLNASVAIAYGSMQQRDVTSALSTVSGSELTKSTHPHLAEALTGRLNGLTVSPSNYEPGNSDYSLYLRGLKTTASNNAPLVLVDDVERDYTQLSVNEIESVTALKDASALALYGSRGANGVILIKTKRGQANQRNVTIVGQTGMQQVQGLHDYLNAYDYATLYNKAWQLDGNTADFYTAEAVEGYRKTVTGSADANPYIYPNNDYQAQFIDKMSYSNKVDVLMNGGTEDARYFAMVGFTRQQGLFNYGDVNDDYNTNTDYQRFNFRSNIDLKLNDITTAFVDMSGRIELRHYPGESAYNIFNALTSTPANAYPIFNPNNTLGGTSSYLNNPYGLITQSGYSEYNRRLFETQVGFKLDFGKWVDGLSFMARTGFDFSNLQNRGLNNDFKVYQYLPATETYNEFGTNSSSQYTGAVAGTNYYRHISGHSQIDYQHVFANKHSITGMGFFDLSQRSYPGNSPKYKTIGFGARAQYNYDRKYYLEGLISTTACEAYMSGNRWGYFPAVSAGWVISEESFLKDSPIVSFLKLRVSTGKTGSERPFGIDAAYRFLYLDAWSTSASGYSFGNPQTAVGGTSESLPGNPDLQGEEAQKNNIGLDAELLKNHIYLSYDIYNEKRTGIWVQPSGEVMSTYGSALPVENGGETESNGMELTLGTKGSSNGFKYDVKAMVSYMQSKVIDLKEEPKLWDYQYAAGQEIGEIYTLTSLGFFADDADIANSPSQASFGTIRPGDIKYLDYNNDGVVDNNDYAPTNKNWFPSTVFSFMANVEYKGFDFSMLWQGMADRYTYDPLPTLPFVNKNATTKAFDAWTPETAATAKYPRLTTSNYSNNVKSSDFWLEDASFIKLKSVELGYTLPMLLTRRIGFDQVRFYANGANLLTLSKVDFDPLSPQAGITQYPATKVYTLGINLSF